MPNERRSSIISDMSCKEYGISQIIRDKEFFFAFNAQIVLTSCLFGCLAVNNLLFAEVYGFSPNKSSICYALTVPAYALGGFCTAKMFKYQIMRRRSMIVMAFLICGVS